MDAHRLLEPTAWIGLAPLLAAGLLLYIAALTAVTFRMLRRPPRKTYGWAVARGVPGDPSEMPEPRRFERWTFSRAGLEFGVWDIEGDRSDGPVVVATHGWGGSRVEMLSRLPALAPEASRIILWDLPGCGETGGVCTLGGREPADLLALLGVVGEPAVLLGHSFGAEVSLRAAREAGGTEPIPGGAVRGLILEAPYRRGITPARNILRAAGFPHLVNLPAAMALTGLLNRRGPRSYREDLAPITPDGVPVLVLHGSADRICPPEESRAFPGEFVLVESAGHNDVFEHEGVADRVGAFLRRVTDDTDGRGAHETGDQRRP